MRALRCPRCRSEFVRRSSRRGLAERLSSLVYVYPFRCQLCQHRFRAFRWKERYVRTVPDRRELERVPADFGSTVWWRHRHREGRVVDLSMAGCSLETDAEIPEGEVLQVKLDAVSEERGIVVDRAVVRSVQPGRLGLQFIRVQEDEEGRLRQYLYEVFVSRLR